MKEQVLKDWINRTGCNIETKEIVQAIFDAGTTREVQSKVGNVITMSPSQINGDEIFTESRTVEFPYKTILERDRDVAGYIAQPLAMDLRYTGKNGRTIHINYTPDFFVFRMLSAGWVETKPEEKLEELSKEQPGRYQKIDGVWRSLPAEEYAARFGLTYTIVSDAQFSEIYIRNIHYLQSYYDAKDQLHIPPDVINDVMRYVSSYPAITLKEIQEEITDCSADHINGMIAKELIWVDLEAALLVQPKEVKIYSTRSTAAVQAKYQPLQEIDEMNMNEFLVEGMKIWWLGVEYEIFRLHENIIILEDKKGEKIKIKRHDFDKFAVDGDITLVSKPNFKTKSSEQKNFSPEEWELARKQCEIVEEYMDTGKIPDGFDKADKTLLRWVAKYMESKEEHGDPIYGLLPKHYLKGCHKVRISLERLKVLTELFKTHYLSLSCPNVASAYAAIVHDSKERGFEPPSRKLFKSMRDDFGLYEAELARAGKRAAQKYKGPSPTDPNRFPAEGEWFLHRVHIDHIHLPLQILNPETNKSLGNAWLTLLTDSCTRSACGSYITMEKPSRKSVFMALRNLIERHKKFPEFLIADNGKDFRSYDYKCLAARYRFTLDWRPPSEAQFGSPVERHAETIQQMFINNLQGRDFPVQEARVRTGKYKSVNRALWPLPDLKVELNKFLYEDYDQMQHPSLLMSPKEARILAIKEHGEREHRNIEPDEEFFFLTTPVIKTKHGYAKVVPGRGIKTNRTWYNCEEFKGVAGKKVQVRMDPSNPERCYACINRSIVPLKRHITNSAKKKMYKSCSPEVYDARVRETARANNGINLDIRGNMMVILKAKEDELRANKAIYAVNQTVYPQKKSFLNLKLVPKKS